MLESRQDAATGSSYIILSPNSSLTPWQARALLAVIGLMMVSIAAGFAGMGLWLVLPFSGAEWLLLAYCFWLSFRSNSVREVITITESTVVLERGRGKPEQSYRFQRAWVGLDWKQSPYKGHPSRLCFRMHGKKFEVGRFLAETERKELARELQTILFDG